MWGEVRVWEVASRLWEVPMNKITRYMQGIFCALLAISTGATAHANDRKEPRVCSNRTLFGDYGTQIEGTILGPNLPLRTVAMAHYDGEGNVASVDHVVVNGQLPPEEWRQSTATYTVNPDCTGKETVVTAPGLPPIVVYFVVVKDGREIHGVVEGAAITFVAYRVD
jgi:hypothetical protein